MFILKLKKTEASKPINIPTILFPEDDSSKEVVSSSVTFKLNELHMCELLMLEVTLEYVKHGTIIENKRLLGTIILREHFAGHGAYVVHTLVFFPKDVYFDGENYRHVHHSFHKHVHDWIKDNLSVDIIE